MIYEILLHPGKQIFVVSKSSAASHPDTGAMPWGVGEAVYVGDHWVAVSPFEMVLSDDLPSAAQDYEIEVPCSWGTVTVMASQIDHTLIQGA